MIRKAAFYFTLPTLIIASHCYPKGVAEQEELAKHWMRNQPVRFLENKGQMMDENGAPVPNVFFKVEAPGLDMYITDKGLSYIFIKQEEEREEEKEGEKNGAIAYSRVDMILKGANIRRENLIKELPSEAHYNFFYGHCPDGIYGVKKYEKIIIREIYPGIDWVLYNSEKKGFKYDFVVHSGADPKDIELVYSSRKQLKLTPDGSIEIKTKYGTLTEQAPVSFQNEQAINTRFIKTLNIENENGGYDTHIEFEINDYRSNAELIIDPQLVWGTYYGGSGLESFTGVATDNAGNVFITGYTISTNFPTQSSGTAYYQSAYASPQSALILKFNNSGALLWASYYGATPCIVNGGGTDGHDITVDVFGNVYVVGREGCATFPTQNMAGAYFQAASAVAQPFILKFDNAGNRLWATTFGGGLSFGGGQSGRCKYVTTDALGNMFICGYGLTGLPSVNPGGGAYTQAAAGGYDMFFAKFNTAGALVWSTYYGGSADDYAIALTVDNGNNLIATGQSNSGNFPMLNPGGVAYFNNTYNGAGDATVIKFSNNGNLLWSTYFGGSGFERGYSIDCDSNDDIFLTGETASANFPVQNPGAGAYFDNTFNGGTKDVFVCKFLNNYSLFWSTYYGGINWEGMMPGNAISYEKMGIITDNCSNVYVTGTTTSTDFPTYNNAACNSFFYSGTFSGTALFILKFGIAGNRLWATLTPKGFGQDLTVDMNDNLFVVGENSEAFLNSTGAYFDTTPFMSDQGCINKFSPPPPSFTQTQVNPGSCVCNGSATINLTSGCSTPPFNYYWSNGTSTLNTTNASNTLSNLCPGTYWVYVTDATCNNDTVYYTLTGAPGSVSLASVQTNVSCTASCDGSSVITPSGGASPYSYTWSNGQTSATAVNLCPGNYSTTVTDGGGCTAVRNISISKAPLIHLETSSRGTCTSGSGVGKVVASGGIPAYTYLWSTGQTADSTMGLSQGVYTVTVTDGSKRCTQTKTLNVTSATITISKSQYNDPCGMGNNATPSVTSGGTKPYTYTWSSGQTSLVITGLPQGSYTLTVTDATGCTATTDFTFTNPPIGPTATFTQSPSGTVCKNTLISFTHTGTTGSGVTYTWLISPVTPTNVSGTTTDFSYTFLSVGTYTVSHSVNKSGCSSNTTSTVTVIDCSGGPTVTTTANSVCPGSCATVTSTATGGSGAYTYSWSTGETTQDIIPCPASTTTYTVKVTDAGGATATSTAIVTVNPAVTVTATSTNITCSGTSTGSITATPGGGTPAFNYVWSNGITSSTGSNLAAGNYTVTVIDSKGCTSFSTTTITAPPALLGQYTKGTANCPPCGCKEWIMVTGINGTPPYNYQWPDGYDKRYKNALCPGVYNVLITDNNGCKTTVKIDAP